MMSKLWDSRIARWTSLGLDIKKKVRVFRPIALLMEATLSHFTNQPAPKKYIDMGFSPLHARCISLFDCLMDDFHQVRFDNLYMSAKVCLRLFQHDRKVMVEGVTRTSQHGLPKQVIQHEVKKPSNMAKVKETVKEAALENCQPLADAPLVACSTYF